MAATNLAGRILAILREAPVEGYPVAQLADRLGASRYGVHDAVCRLIAEGRIVPTYGRTSFRPRLRGISLPGWGSSDTEAAYREGQADAVIALFRAGYLRAADPNDVAHKLGIDPEELRAAGGRAKGRRLPPGSGRHMYFPEAGPSIHDGTVVSSLP